MALLPPGLVEPATKVLPIAGDGPFGLFGPDLFGDPEARALPYPVMGSAPADGPGALDPAWTAYDASQIWTLTSIGSLCADRLAAHHAVTLGKGWDWPFNGGTAAYEGAPFINPNPPAGISAFPIVQSVETGNDGVTASISRRADVALADHKCPILTDEAWAPTQSGPPSLAVPEAVLTRWKDFLGIDAVYLAADHQSDRGAGGISSTLQLLDEYGFPHTGLGMNLDEALEPAYVEVAGLKVAFVSWNEVTGPVHAAPGVPGVAWLTQENVDAAVGRARAAGADVVICNPQWWGGDEYHPDLFASQQEAVVWMDEAGCDQIVGGGLHVSGGMFLRERPNGVSLIHAGPGNYMYGQPWWQETQEGIILDMTFRGTTLVNVRLHPYVMVESARAEPHRPGGRRPLRPRADLGRRARSITERGRRPGCALSCRVPRPPARPPPWWPAGWPPPCGSCSRELWWRVIASQASSMSIGDGEQVEVLRADLLLVQRLVPDPLHHPLPVVLAVQDDREVLDLAGLDQGQRLEQLVERPEAAGEDDEALRRTSRT